MDRFWSKVDKGSGDECWQWTASKDRAGYGEFSLNSRTAKAHRVSYCMANPHEDIAGLCVLHRCDNPGCVNPNHLFSGTHQDNVADKCSKNRGRWREHKGSANGSSKLTERDVIQILEMKGKKSQVAIAEIFCVSQATISSIHLKKGWKHVA